MLTNAIKLLKKARKRELGRVTTLAGVVALLQPEIQIDDRHHIAEPVCERMSVVIDALAFHAGEVCTDPETINAIITLLSEMRQALRSVTQ